MRYLVGVVGNIICRQSLTLLCMRDLGIQVMLYSFDCCGLAVPTSESEQWLAVTSNLA